MRTCTEKRIVEYGMLTGMGFGRMPRGNVGKVAKAAHAANGERTLIRHVKNVALFFAAPFIGLAYMLAFPLIGVALLVGMAATAVMKNEKTRPFALAFAAPVIALAFVTVGPIVALGALVATGARALLHA